MNIRQADPQQLKDLAVFFDKTFSPKDSCFVRKLSYCLARGTCYILESSATKALEGAILLDRDLVGFERVVAVSASDSTNLKALLEHALTKCASKRLFLTSPPEDSPLSSAASEAGFTPCGELTLPESIGQVSVLSAQSACNS